MTKSAPNHAPHAKTRARKNAPSKGSSDKSQPDKSQPDKSQSDDALSNNSLSNNSLSNNERRDLKRIAHHLRPVVTVAERGMTDGVRAEVERALQDHELIKVKVAVADRALRVQLIQQLCADAHANLVSEIGKVAVLFRHNAQAKPHLSNLQRPAPASRAR